MRLSAEKYRLVDAGGILRHVLAPNNPRSCLYHSAADHFVGSLIGACNAQNPAVLVLPQGLARKGKEHVATLRAVFRLSGENKDEAAQLDQWLRSDASDAQIAVQERGGALERLDAVTKADIDRRGTNSDNLNGIHGLLVRAEARERQEAEKEDLRQKRINKFLCCCGCEATIETWGVNITGSFVVDFAWRWLQLRGWFWE